MFALLAQEEDPKIAAMRARNEERRKRILDPAIYQNGADQEGLAAQVAEKQAAAAAERAANAGDADTLKGIDKATMMIARQQAEDRKRILQETLDYRAANQGLTRSDAFALNDPDELKKTVINESDFGTSSLQVFDGEDRGFAERKAHQQSQVRQWTVQAGEAMAATQRSVGETKALEEDTLSKQYQMTMALEAESQQYLRGTREMFAATNLEQAAEQRRLRKEAQAAEAAANQNDMLATVSGPLISEDPALQFSPSGKLLTDRFKGFSADQLAEIRAAQKVQELEMSQRKAGEAAETDEYGKDLRTQAKAVYLLERETHRQKMASLQSQVEENKRLAAEKAARDAPLKNEIDSSFYSQFQTSCR